MTDDENNEPDDLNDAIDAYFDLHAKILKAAGYRERWRAFPLDDCRDQFWAIRDYKVWSSDRREAIERIVAADKDDLYFESHDGEFSDELSDCHICGETYRAEGLVFIEVDTQTDGNVFLQIFNDAKEVKRPAPAPKPPSCVRCGAEDATLYLADDGRTRCREHMVELARINYAARNHPVVPTPTTLLSDPEDKS